MIITRTPIHTSINTRTQTHPHIYICIHMHTFPSLCICAGTFHLPFLGKFYRPCFSAIQLAPADGHHPIPPRKQFIVLDDISLRALCNYLLDCIPTTCVYMILYIYIYLYTECYNRIRLVLPTHLKKYARELGSSC